MSKKSYSMSTEEWLLANCREPVPQWLRDHRAGGGKPTLNEVLAGHVLYYPGAGFDGEPVRIFNRSHSAHVFLYVDYGVSREELTAELERRHFSGYHSLGRFDFAADEIADVRFTPHVRISPEKMAEARKWAHAKPFCMMDILERDPDCGNDFGAERFALIFLGADGIAAYDALFGNSVYPNPFAVVLHDHGSGGNYDKFGRGGLLEECAANTESFPELLLVAFRNTEAWDGYVRIEDIAPADAGGYFVVPHALYRRG